MLPVSSEAQCPLRFGSSIIEVPNIIRDRDHTPLFRGVPCACLVPTLPDPFLLFAARRNRFREVSHLTAVKRRSAIICHNKNKRMRILREGHVIEEMDSRPSSDV